MTDRQGQTLHFGHLLPGFTLHESGLAADAEQTL